MLQLGVAKELGYTLTELLEKITMEDDCDEVRRCNI